MINGTLADVARHTHGQLRGAALRYRGISTDTRTLAADELFVALKGEQFDAHDYLDATSAAAGVLLSRECVTAGPQVMVADTRRALGDLAQAWRRAHSLPVVAVTGSRSLA
jgi:UDP-N-acetylmuramoyl-tripeptide--D-alanyl-D-alanine ligase